MKSDYIHREQVQKYFSKEIKKLRYIRYFNEDSKL